MKKGYLYKVNSILSIVQLFFLLSFFFAIVIIFTSENDQYGFTTNIDAWFESNWITGHTNSFRELFSVNGWIILYQTIIVIALWSLIFVIFIEFVVLRNYFMIANCQHSKNKHNKSNVKCSFCLEKEILGLKSSKKIILASIFSFAMTVFWAKVCKKLNYTEEANKILFEPTQICSINSCYFFKSLVSWKMINYNSFLTSLLYLLLVSTFSGLLMMWVSYALRFPIFIEELKNFTGTENQEAVLYDSFIRLSPLTSVLTYFTQFTNISCFIYTMFILLKPKANFFKNNTVTIFLASYIIIVGIVYWLFLHEINFAIAGDLPNSVKDYVTVDFATTLILHGTTPLLFGIFAFAIIGYNGIKPRKYWSLWGKYIIYPLIYATFMYSLPFFTKVVVYGPISNLNVNNTNEIYIDVIGNITFSEAGNPIYILFAFAAALLFALFLFLFWGYAKFINKIQNSKFKKQASWMINPCVVNHDLTKESKISNSKVNE